jgi:hypothetical protein
MTDVDERRVTVGQSAGEPDAIRDHGAIALASLADAEVVVVADGGAGVPPSRAAADAVVRAVTRTCQGSSSRRPSALLGESFGEAHRALLALGGSATASSGIGAACVAAVVHGGVATIARAGRMAAFHVRAGVADAVFPEPAVALPAELGPRPLGIGVDAPPPTEIEVVPLEPGDRIVLCTVSVARSVDALTLARTAWTLEPQVAAARLAEMARRSGTSTAAVQVIRREAPAIADALELLQPARQRQIGRQQDEARAVERRERQRRLATIAFWGLVAAGIVAAVVGWLVGSGRRAAGPSSPAVVVDGATDSDAAGAASGATEPAGDGGRLFAVATPGGADAGPAPADARGPATPADGAAADGGAAPGAAAVRAPDVDRGPLADGPNAAVFAALDDIFQQDTHEAAKDLRRWIVERYARGGERVFATLEGYIRARPGQQTVSVLVSLLVDHRPPPKTRAWLRELLPRLVTPEDLP